ncbi:ricin-type beta-trefoil lectin domain protein [Streptomyces sp. NPDC046203]|uniref:RICIN domain-containing protein n=1 Tax=Streptomyces sp. NPDC046203 TaxID=3154602 RepID=UPI0033E1C2EF
MKIRKGLGGVAATVGAAALLLTGTTTTAHAAGGPSGGTWRLQNSKTSLCLDSTGTGKVFTATCSSSTASQHWVYTPVNGKIQLKNTGTGRCLKPTNAFSLVVETRPCGIDDNDYWEEVFVSGKLRLVSPGGNALDSDAKGNAYLNQYGPDNPYQQWYLTTSMS